jgi:hypothetical protein
MEEILGYRVKLLERLKDQPSELQEAINAIPESEWKLRQDAAGRTIHQIVAHIRDVEVLAFLPRFQRFLTEEQPFFEPFSSHTWSAADYQAAEPMTKMLADFAQARAKVWELMRPLTPEDWSRLAVHPPSGRRTAQWWAERIYVHAQDHLKEIRRAT